MCVFLYSFEMFILDLVLEIAPQFSRKSTTTISNNIPTLNTRPTLDSMERPQSDGRPPMMFQNASDMESSSESGSDWESECSQSSSSENNVPIHRKRTFTQDSFVPPPPSFHPPPPMMDSKINGIKKNMAFSPPPTPPAMDRHDSFRSQTSVASSSTPFKNNLANLLNSSARLRASSRSSATHSSKSVMKDVTAASLARNRKEHVASPKVGIEKKKRAEQLSAEGRDMLKFAIESGSTKHTVDRKGLFDDSSDEDDDDSSLDMFSTSTKSAAMATPKMTAEKMVQSSKATFRPPMANLLADIRAHGSDSESNSTLSFMSPKSIASPQSISAPHTTSSTGNGPNHLIQNNRIIQVECLTFQVDRSQKKPFATYTFRLSFENTFHEFTISYHELDDIHDRFGPEAPKFPSKHWYRNNTKESNMAKRSIELTDYLTELVRKRSIVESERFQFEFKVPNEFMNKVRNHPTSPNASTINIPTSLPPAFSPSSFRNASQSPTSTMSHDELSPTSTINSPLSSIRIESTQSRRPNSIKSRPNSIKSHQGSVRSRQGSIKDQQGSIRSRPPSTKKVAGLPERPNLFGGGRGALLAAIRKGGNAPLVSTRRPPSPVAVQKEPSMSDAIANAMAARRLNVASENLSYVDSDADSADWQ